MTAVVEGLFFDFANADEVLAAHEIEKVGFLSEEAASLETFKTRQSIAPKLFLGAYIPPRTLIGYVNATISSSPSITVESMHMHDPTGTSVCIHAVAVAEIHRRKGIARKLLGEYLRRLEDDPEIEGIRVQRVLLLCHENLVLLYKSVGFTLVGKSSVVHGPLPWFEMRIEFPSPVVQEHAVADVPPNILEALNISSGSRPPPRLFSAFASSQDLVSPSGGNMFDILCPRLGCGSIILKAGVAKFRSLDSFELEPNTHTPPAPLQRLPPPPAQVDWWLVTPSPMAFENIAFSRPVPSESSSGSSQTKLLACAECDLGPFGWSKVGGNEFWLALSRVGYRL